MLLNIFGFGGNPNRKIILIRMVFLALIKVFQNNAFNILKIITKRLHLLKLLLSQNVASVHEMLEVQGVTKLQFIANLLGSSTRDGSFKLWC